MPNPFTIDLEQGERKFTFIQHISRQTLLEGVFAHDKLASKNNGPSGYVYEIKDDNTLVPITGKQFIESQLEIEQMRKSAHAFDKLRGL